MPDPITAAIGGTVFGGVANIIGGESAADSAEAAARTSSDAQVQSTAMATASQERMFNKSLDLTKQYRDLGDKILPYLEKEVTEFKPLEITTPSVLKAAYDYQVSDAVAAANMSLEKMGMSQSGKGVRLLADVVSRIRADQAVKEYGLGLEKAVLDDNRRYGRTLDLANIGLGPTTQAAGLATQTGTTMATIQNESGKVQANALLSGGLQSSKIQNSHSYDVGNTINSALGTYMNYRQNQSILNMLQPMSTGSPVLSGISPMNYSDSMWA